MSEVIEPKLPKWPFYLGDVLLLGFAYLVYRRNQGALSHWDLALAAVCIIAGAGFAIAPFILEHRASMKLAEAGGLATAVGQLRQIDTVAAQIAAATGQWQEVQKQAEKTAGGARETAERMAGEIKAFSEFMQRANDGEKATLRLEVEKLRRGEGDWLQVLVHMLDHTFALHQGALRSGQQNVIAQLGHFQSVCHDAARRVGLHAVAAQPGEAFDAQKHQSIEEGAPAADATVLETVAPGFTFQGKPIRPIIVRLNTTVQGHAVTDSSAATDGGTPPPDQTQLPLGQPETPR
jgi:molecular chaperone GrpE (heat shock protein)